MSNNVVTLKSGSKITRGHRHRHVSIASYDFLLTFRRKLWPISHRFRNRRRFQSIPYILRPTWNGSPWNWVSSHGIKKLEWWCYWVEQEVWRYLQPSG